ncbi:MAG: aldo/keto reductase [Longimicrobiales bacterium]
MERIRIECLERDVARIGLGTWSIGGLFWGGTPEAQAVATIRAALDLGIDLIDTAPVYGHGRAEELVARALREHGRDRDTVVIATKCGLDWDDHGDWVDGRPQRVLAEVEQSLRRLRTDAIDIYFVHWPDPLVDVRQTAEAMERLWSRGVIRAIGVSNFDVARLELFRQAAPVHACEPPYNLFERGIERELLPYCREHGIFVTAYGPLCRGLLGGRMTADTSFGDDDVRRSDPKLQPPRLDRYLAAVRALDAIARERWQSDVATLALRWALDTPGIDVALLGARRPEHLELVRRADDIVLDEEACVEVGAVLDGIPHLDAPDFLAPPTR